MALNSQPLFLFGAGASQEAGVPLSAELTEKLQLWMGAKHTAHAPLFNYIIDTIDRDMALTFGHKNYTFDIEEAVSAIGLLAERKALQISPFVQNWDPTIERLDLKTERLTKVADVVSRRLAHTLAVRVDQAIHRHPNWTEHGVKYLLGDIYPAVLQLTNLRADDAMANFGSRIQELQLFVHAGIREMVTVQNCQRVEFLRPVFDFAKDHPVKIFSLNFDDAVELGGEHFGVSVDDGLREKPDGSSQFEWDEQAGVKLYKLHGSMSWGWDPLDHATYRLSKADKEQVPAIVCGRRGKLREDGPYLDLLFEFSVELEKHETLFVVGYSFRDAHINRYLRRFAQKNRRIFVINGPTFALPTEVAAWENIKTVPMTAGTFFKDGLPDYGSLPFHQRYWEKIPVKVNAPIAQETETSA